jgi:hypothetical protein
MTTPAKVLIVGALAALGVGWLWLRSSDAPAVPEPTQTATNESDVPVVQAPASVIPPTAVRESTGDTASSRREVDEDRVASLARKMAAPLGQMAVRYLTTQGLSREDGERVVGEGARVMAMCQIDAMRAQATAQSQSFEELLGVIEALSSPDTIVLPPSLDGGAVFERAAPCMMSVQQRIGLPAMGFGLFARGPSQ